MALKQIDVMSLSTYISVNNYDQTVVLAACRKQNKHVFSAQIELLAKT